MGNLLNKKSPPKIKHETTLKLPSTIEESEYCHISGRMSETPADILAKQSIIYRPTDTSHTNTITSLSEISGSHGGEYLGVCLLGCCSM
jgi:hypothetical protein